MRLILAFGITFLLFTNIRAQDTIRLQRKPHVILKSWYPEFKEFPELKVGETKILFTIIPDLKDTFIRDNDINLVPVNDLLEIVETEKSNQYLVKVSKSESKYIEFEIWFDLGNFTILLKKNSQWEDVRNVYPFKDNRIIIQKIRLKIAK